MTGLIVVGSITSWISDCNSQVPVAEYSIAIQPSHPTLR